MRVLLIIQCIQYSKYSLNKHKSKSYPQHNTNKSIVPINYTRRFQYPEVHFNGI